MKRQSLGSQSGFTLFELMIVIAILGIFIATTNVFNYTPQTESEKADRMQVSIVSMLRGQLQNVSIGRMPNRDGKMAGLIRMDIGTGSIITRYFTGSDATIPILTENFSTPFYDKDSKYEIKSVTWTGSATSGDWYAGSGILFLTPGGIVFSGTTAGIEKNMLLEIKVGYLTRSRKVILDRRTGKLTETRLY